MHLRTYISHIFWSIFNQRGGCLLCSPNVVNDPVFYTLPGTLKVLHRRIYLQQSVVDPLNSSLDTFTQCSAINVECWICDNCRRWRERLIAAVAGRVKLLEVTAGSPFVSPEQPDFKAAWPNRRVPRCLSWILHRHELLRVHVYWWVFILFCSYASTLVWSSR